MQDARTHAKHDYPSGSTLTLVTWAEADDPRWFGAKIPRQVKSVEFVFVHSSGDGTSYAYQKYQGSPLKMESFPEGPRPKERSEFLLSEHTSVLP